MADNTRVNELQEKLLQAMDILNAQALNSISFDKTIACTIENDENKKDGKYEVSDGSIIFTAYSTDESYRNGDVVYVTIPQGNYENQKMIIGKKTSETEKPFNFVTPFDSFFSMTGNLAVTAQPGGLVANDIEDNTKPIEECMTYIPLLGKNGLDTSGMDLINYTRLGIKADFKSWIKNAVKGNYGLEIILSTEKQGTVNGKKETATHTYGLDSSNMYGNPYNFETYYNQELVLDISGEDIGKVTNIQVNFYQAANFYDQFNEPIPSSLNGFKTEVNTNRYVYYPVDNEQGETTGNSGYYIPLGDKLNSNLFIDNLEIHFGYDISIFANDYVEIYTQDRSSYKRSTSTETDNSDANKKEINMRWVHMVDGTPVDMVAAADKTTDEEKAKYEVRWYRYRVGAAAADSYCGIYWERMYVDENNFLRQQNEEDKNTEIPFGNIKQFTGLRFDPDVNKQQEKIKAIVIYEKNTPYRSNELIFENEEALPPSEEAQHIMNALNIECDDNTNGNYMIYGQDNSIKDTEFGKITRTLSVYFDVNNDGKIDKDNEKVSDLENVKWTFPAKNTMINLLNSDKKAITVGEGDEQQIIAYTFNSETEYPQYTINNHYSPSKDNNTIECEYSLNGVIYTTEKEFTFGPSGTMGTEQTLIIDFVGDRKAIDTTDNNCEIQVQLYDNQNQLITDLNNITWSWYYRSDENLYFNETEEKNKQIISLIKSPNADIINGLYIIQVNVGDLETYFPIPIKVLGYNYISGPTQVIYSSNGSPLYNQDAYELKPIINQSDIAWRIRVDRKGYIYKEVVQEEKNKTNFNDGIYYQKVENKFIWVNPTTNSYDVLNSYYIREEKNEKCYINNSDEITSLEKNLNFNGNEEIENYLPTLTNKKLKPLNVYVKEAPIYGVQALNNNKVVWTQPILVLQNKWPNGVINKWDGESLVLDEANSTIISAALSAGKKNSEDNTFSGVMIGDWEGQDAAEDITKQTGIYGFHHGAMSYAFKEDGTAFLGKDGKGRIYIDGNDATIYSQAYEDGRGIKIDLNEPYLVIQSNEYKIKKSTNTYPFQIGSNFQVKWDGTIYATNGEFSGCIKGESGTIGQWTIADSNDEKYPGALYSDDKNIILDPNGDGSIILKKGKSKISGGILSSSGSEQTIQLEGYLEVGNGTLGYVASNSPAAENPDGIGLTYTVNNNSSHSRVIASKVNAALGFGNAYVTAETNHVGLGGGSNGTFGMCTKEATIISDLGINTDEMDSTKDIFYCSVPASNQWGIYARFA